MAFGQGLGGGGRFRAPKDGGRGRQGGPKAGGPGGACVCPKCGHKVTHVIGQPCYNVICPKCGAPMTRG